MMASLACPSYENLYQYTRFCGTAQIPKAHAREEICQEGAMETISTIADGAREDGSPHRSLFQLSLPDKSVSRPFFRFHFRAHRI